MALEYADLWPPTMGPSIATAEVEPGRVSRWITHATAPNGFLASGITASFAETWSTHRGSLGLWVRSLSADESEITGSAFIPWCAIATVMLGSGIVVKAGPGNGRWALRILVDQDSGPARVLVNWSVSR